MTIGAISTGPATAARDRAAMTRDQFLQILVTELKSQDPLEPLDQADFMQQLVGLQNLEQTSALTDGLRSFEGFLQMSSGSALIGRTVKGTTAGGEAVEGLVTRVTVENGEVRVVVDGRSLPLASVTDVSA